MKAEIQLQATPKAALIDELVQVHVSGLEADQLVEVSARQRDAFDRLWQSTATFRADAGGCVDLATSAAQSGTYLGVDPTGLFWSMQLVEAGERPTPFARSGIDLLFTTLSVIVDGETVAETEIERRFVSPDVMVTEVEERGLAGRFFLPGEAGPYPALLVVSGSGGGLGGAEDVAAMLASHGYATLALAYFNFEGRPPYLISIPLEYFETALDWLAEQEHVDSDRIGVVGRSRGGELALLLGATFPQLKAVVGYVPSGIVHGGIGEDSAGKPAWTWRGEPVPFLKDSVTPEQDAEIFGAEPSILTERFNLNLRDKTAVQAAIIHVERINGSVLMLSGTDDKLWPSTRLADIAYDRLEEFNHPYPYQHLRYDGAGHSITLPYLPTTVTTSFHPIRKHVFDLGGAPVPQARANTDSWHAVLEFLGENL